MTELPWWLAFLAGGLSILTPCVLALLPAYMTFLSGVSVAEAGTGTRRGRILLSAGLFVLGFSTVFTAFGASASLLGQFLIEYQVLLRQIAGVLIFVLGLHTAGLLGIPFLERERRWQVKGRPGHPVHAFLIGTAFAAGWTPCVGPILGSILLLAGTGPTVWGGVALLLAYSAGMAVPFLLVAGFMGHSRRVLGALSKWGHVVSVLGGILLMIMGVMVFTNIFVRLAGLFDLQWLP